MTIIIIIFKLFEYFIFIKSLIIYILNILINCLAFIIKITRFKKRSCIVLIFIIIINIIFIIIIKFKEFLFFLIFIKFFYNYNYSLFFMFLFEKLFFLIK